jgi:hypothetical protein
MLRFRSAAIACRAANPVAVGRTCRVVSSTIWEVPSTVAQGGELLNLQESSLSKSRGQRRLRPARAATIALRHGDAKHHKCGGRAGGAARGRHHLPGEVPSAIARGQVDEQMLGSRAWYTGSSRASGARHEGSTSFNHALRRWTGHSPSVARKGKPLSAPA